MSTCLTSRPRVANSFVRGYRWPVAANSANGFCSPTSKRRNSAPIMTAGAFFVPAVQCYGGCAQDTFGCAGFLLLRSANLRTAATKSCFAAGSGSSTAKGAPPMTALIPSAIRALVHRRMALSALRANSSLSVRLKRYNAHMTIVRSCGAIAFNSPETTLHRVVGYRVAGHD